MLYNPKKVMKKQKGQKSVSSMQVIKIFNAKYNVTLAKETTCKEVQEGHTSETPDCPSNLGQILPHAWTAFCLVYIPVIHLELLGARKS